MGHKKKDGKSGRTLHQQAYDKLQKMQAFGDSKRLDKLENPEEFARKIYSFSTYQTYFKHIKYFIKWLQREHPEVKTLKKAEKFVPEWLQTRVDKGLSAWTIQTEEAALNKLYGIKIDNENRFQPPKRRKENIMRSRGVKKRDAHFSGAANEELVNFCKACGFRRNVLERLTGSDLYDRAKAETALSEAQKAGDEALATALSVGLKIFPEQDYFILHRRDKGGKTRLSPIVGPHKNQVIQRMKATPKDEKVWQYVNTNLDVHGYRSDYATFLYKQCAKRWKRWIFTTKSAVRTENIGQKSTFAVSASAGNGLTAVRSASSASRSATAARTPRLRIISVIFKAQGSQGGNHSRLSHLSEPLLFEGSPFGLEAVPHPYAKSAHKSLLFNYVVLPKLSFSYRKCIQHQLVYISRPFFDALLSQCISIRFTARETGLK